MQQALDGLESAAEYASDVSSVSRLVLQSHNAFKTSRPTECLARGMDNLYEVVSILGKDGHIIPEKELRALKKRHDQLQERGQKIEDKTQETFKLLNRLFLQSLIKGWQRLVQRASSQYRARRLPTGGTEGALVGPAEEGPFSDEIMIASTSGSTEDVVDAAVDRTEPEDQTSQPSTSSAPHTRLRVPPKARIRSRSVSHVEEIMMELSDLASEIQDFADIVDDLS
ncbi:hypothetical protein NM688_g4865 [Phlebia brevispora]|uniref:Uncharacterized protein n=1 Tax=Phlebia brevispora TaxID=194682 RepID=A0ACC1T1X3_9APHY|nr:hypothetical protein NM688_g4865 [Phlebia brevispora]